MHALGYVLGFKGKLDKIRTYFVYQVDELRLLKLTKLDKVKYLVTYLDHYYERKN